MQVNQSACALLDREDTNTLEALWTIIHQQCPDVNITTVI